MRPDPTRPALLSSHFLQDIYKPEQTQTPALSSKYSLSVKSCFNTWPPVSGLGRVWFSPIPKPHSSLPPPPLWTSNQPSPKQSFQLFRPCLAGQRHVILPPSEDVVHGLSETIVGVLGGGQLGRMLSQAASQMAIKVIVLDPQDNCPANQLAYDHMVGSFDDSATVQEFAKRSGVLTVEIEHVDVETLEKLEQQGVDCQPKASTIRII